LKHPVFDLSDRMNFSNSFEIRKEVFELFGTYGPESYFPLVNIYGEDSVAKTEDGWVTIYPPRDVFWYADFDIIKYRILEDVVINKSEKEKKRVIKAIAPVVYDRDYQTGDIVGDKVLFWMNFEDLKPILAENFYIDQTSGKVTSYLDYFSKRMFKAIVTKEENFKVSKRE
ncbi:MAG: hypothetical protein MK078_16925, partial [Crocinitomicaceae bacterium]|nr:hypothetical protein [Crocinitomicaceae bacterium]